MDLYVKRVFGALLESHHTRGLRLCRCRSIDKRTPNFGYFFVLAAAFCLAGKVASASTASVCDHAAEVAASETGVPFQILWSITRTETGRIQKGKLTPWPWTVNMEGKGHWFNSQSDAQNFSMRHFKRGARSFDVGCFQINYRWHGTSFQSIDQMFDPYENARYAARFLSNLYGETGNWSVAAGIYHSRTPEYARSYRARFDRIYNGYRPSQAGWASQALNQSNPSEDHITRTNNYPFIRAGGSTRGKGSLVPMRQNTVRLFIRIPSRSGGS